MPSYPIILSIPMPETWTLTPTASSKRELYDLMFMLRGSTCRVSPYEHRGGVRGVFDLIIDGLTDRERQEILERMKRVGLRRITEEERHAIAAEILLPGQQPEAPNPTDNPPPAP
ncbi:hypothetical protein HYS30_00880 [Candidatus Peregrinibacteria bacterium]|nr:hypothetical protein [Candidatus Peregrinibacteria bacterium]